MIGKVKVTSTFDEDVMSGKKKDPTLGLTPLGKNVAILPEKLPEKSPGGVILPDVSRSRYSIKGQVFAKGPDVTTAVEVGDVVYLPDHGGTRFEIAGQVILIYEEEDLLCKEVE